ncbi:hypothetical protein [Streptomyces natalensis]|uniref:Uncharacterized protein n=1 Tax=Streptomyces natalensis ATCC 27448 TaxID=1240678 RepID=A0A0D7CAI8_9ACTN|nr:hypothetical protein [Streptomyces natalensis]KIZ13279.1 hypothetical protein SNA_38115 [Streptomyces natalensis ATCC 27448]
MPPVPAPATGGSTARSCLAAFLGVVGVLGLLGGGGLVAHAYSNASQVTSNRSGYGATMWRDEPVDKLFPEVLGTAKDTRTLDTDPKHAQWHRLGISEQTGCDQALSGPLAAKVHKLGCLGALRATYVDPTGNTVATVAMIALPKGTDPEEMHAFFSDEEDKDVPPQQVKAYAVPGSLAARWSDARRNASAGAGSSSDLPYVFAVSAGAVDGRTAGRLPGEFGSAGDHGEQDRVPWEGAASSLVNQLNLHTTDLLDKETTT